MRIRTALGIVRSGAMLAAFLVLAGGCGGAAKRGDAVSEARAPIVSQKELGQNACGPCAVMNGLLWGDAALRRIPAKLEGASLEEKVMALIARYGARPSEAYGPRTRRYDETSGVTWVDLTHFVNDLLEDYGIEPVEGAYLDREKDEPVAVYLRRVHQLYGESIRAGMPVVTSVRSFAPRPSSTRNGYVWRGLSGHWVTVVQVQETLRAGEKGFSFEYLDPFTGKLEYGYLFFDEARNFTAAKGDSKNWEWVSSRPFLLVCAPSFRLNTQAQPWNLRTIITLNYAVFRRRG